MLCDAQRVLILAIMYYMACFSYVNGVIILFKIAIKRLVINFSGFFLLGIIVSLLYDIDSYKLCRNSRFSSLLCNSVYGT